MVIIATIMVLLSFLSHCHYYYLANQPELMQGLVAKLPGLTTFFLLPLERKVDFLPDVTLKTLLARGHLPTLRGLVKKCYDQHCGMMSMDCLCLFRLWSASTSPK